MADPQAQSIIEKEKGNVAYRARKFEDAIEHYKAAFALFEDVTYLNNLAAVYFEQGDFDKCIETCEQAVETGREKRADFKIIAKAFARIGSAYTKKKDFDNALKYYQKSLTEHRTPDTLTKLKEAEKEKSAAERLAYIDPALADKAREDGNKLFKAGDFAGSVKLYTEAIKRNPEDPKALTNRATAYTKLLALNEALKDSEEAIKVDSKYVKAYIRKSHVRFAMKDYDKALEAIEEARTADTEHKHTSEITTQERKCIQASVGEQANETDEQRLARAMRDPEVQKILQDPVMNQILQQAQENPASLQEHMKNPQFKANLTKLMQAGIVRMGNR